MKLSTGIFIGIVSLGSTAPVVLAEIAAKPTTTYRPQEEELVDRAKKNPNPLANYKPVELPEDPSIANKPQSLLARSEILCLGESATLVPKRAILNRPKALLSRIGLQQGAKFLIWEEFYAANRGWITTLEVSSAQSEGKESFPEDTLRAISKSSNIVVATYKGGPISVLSDKVGDAANPQKPQ